MYFPLLYAETHYAFRYLRPRYYKREPEVVCDMPTRILTKRTNGKVPFFILVKDADVYPAVVSNIYVEVFFEEKATKLLYSDTINASKKTQSHEWEFEIDDAWIGKNIVVNIHFEVNGKAYINDNYSTSTPHNFTVFISNRERLFPDNWYVGDVHYHSIYTSDQVEFGAPIQMTKKIAHAMGIDWFFVTDHSYDLDDLEEDYTKNDPNIAKWEKMKADVISESDTTLKICYGEEVSIGNARGENVHLLAIEHPNFIHGKGDSAEKWFQNKPDTTIKQIALETDTSLLIAAHPFERVPILQKICLNRGNWTQTDFDDADIKYLQIINGQDIAQNLYSIEKYFKLLLSGKKYYLVAGNDAHGNFQFMKQIKIPFIKLMCRRQQIFAHFITAFCHEKNDPIAGISANNIIVSSGPFINLSIYCDDKKYHIGQTLNAKKEQDIEIKCEYAIDKEHGDIRQIQLITGHIASKTISKRTISHATEPDEYIKEKVGETSFYAALLITKKGYLAMTNPIWIEV